MKNVTLYIVTVLCSIICVSFLLVAVGCPSEKATAEESAGYLRVITEDTPFYADKNADTPLFYLPYTYYVKILERGDYYTHVEYAIKGVSIDGFVPTNKLFEDGLAVNKPFPAVTLTTSETTVLYKDYTLNLSLQYVFEDRNLYYYGKMQSPQGKTLYYVGYNNRLGYVKEEDLMPFAVPNHPNELTFLKADDPEPQTAPAVITDTSKQETTENDGTFNIRIAIIAILGLAGIIALIVALGKKPKTAPAASYYDENDYE